MSELPQGTQPSPEDRKRAKAFFDRGATVAGTGQYDYAIEMFMQGLGIDPDSIEAHQTLRDIAMKRKVSGGKALGMFEKMKLLRAGKDDKQNMLNAEKVLAYDPGNSDAMLSMMQAAHGGSFIETAMWMGTILYRANADSPKPDINKYIKLKDIYRAMSRWDLAVACCQAAVNLRPGDQDLQTELKHLGAQATMTTGNYDKKGATFTEMVKDLDGQKKLMDADKDVHDVDVLSQQLMDAEAEWKAQPEEAGKLMKYVEALCKTERADNENKAIEMLANAFERTKQFRFRHTLGKIRLVQLTRMDRSLRDKLKKNDKDEAVRAEYAQFQHERMEEELKEYTLWAEAYPTDLNLKYEMAKRMFQLGQYSEAIPVLQTARQDPETRNDASVLLGRAFLEAEFVDEAVDTLKDLIEEYQLKGDSRSKEMYYWYARSLEAHKDIQPAQKAYSQVAQWDFNYRDVQQRIKKLRSGGTPPAAPAQ